MGAFRIFPRTETGYLWSVALIGAISAAFFAAGIWLYRSHVQEINDRIPELAFHPDLGALFGLAPLMLIFPCTLAIRKAGKKGRSWLVAGFIGFFAGGLAFSMVFTKVSIERKFEAAGYHRCLAHPLMKETGHRTMSFYQKQAWVLDPTRCLPVGLRRGIRIPDAPTARE